MTSEDTPPRTLRLWLAPMFSGLALIGSVVSMWETTIKQAEVKLHVSDNIYFTRDPWGSYEVLIIPVTIANRGARDGTVLTLSLDVKNLTTNQSKRFKSTYTADAKWFGGRDDVTANLRRPKVPIRAGLRGRTRRFYRNAPVLPGGRSGKESG